MAKPVKRKKEKSSFLKAALCVLVSLVLVRLFWSSHAFEPSPLLLGISQTRDGKDVSSAIFDPSICFTTATYGAVASKLDELISVKEMSERNRRFHFVVFTNLEDFEAPGWTRVVTNLPYRRFITHSRYGKFVAWKEPLIVELCDVVFYLDASRTVANNATMWRGYAKGILDSADGLMQVIHFRDEETKMKGGSPVLAEIDEIEAAKKDLPKNLKGLREWLKSNDLDEKKTTLYNNGVFGYDPRNPRFREVSNSFWERYTLELDSWRDQPLWAYFMHKLKIKPIVLSAARIDQICPWAPIKGHGHNSHTYGEDSNSDALAWSTSQGRTDVDLRCIPLSDLQRDRLRQEIRDYEQSEKFTDKIKELRGEAPIAAHHASIRSYLQDRVLDPGWSVLELGCAAGMMLNVAYEWFKSNNHTYGDLVGVELVTGWVKSSQKYFADTKNPIKVFEGDVTDFTLPAPFSNATFDFVMLNDVLEHLDPKRYGCFFQKLKEVTHDGSILYAHTPSPEAQLWDASQYFENTLPHHVVISGLTRAGFELVTFEHDVDTSCGTLRSLADTLPRALRGTRCGMGGWTKYTHMVFQRPKDTRVFQLH